MKSMLTFQAIWCFAVYFASGIVLLAAFTRFYIFFTPYDEKVHIKAGKKAPAIALVGAMIGFVMPILSMSYHGASFVEFILWSVIAGIIQLVCFKILYWIMPNVIEADNTAGGIFYAGAAICTGLISAFSLIPS